MPARESAADESQSRSGPLIWLLALSKKDRQSASVSPGLCCKYRGDTTGTPEKKRLLAGLAYGSAKTTFSSGATVPFSHKTRITRLGRCFCFKYTQHVTSRTRVCTSESGCVGRPCHQRRITSSKFSRRISLTYSCAATSRRKDRSNPHSSRSWGGAR